MELGYGKYMRFVVLTDGFVFLVAVCYCIAQNENSIQVHWYNLQHDPVMVLGFLLNRVYLYVNVITHPTISGIGVRLTGLWYITI